MATQIEIQDQLIARLHAARHNMTRANARASARRQLLAKGYTDAEARVIVQDAVDVFYLEEAAGHAEREQALTVQRGDALARMFVVGVDTLDQLLDKWVDHGYRPTLYVDQPMRELLADAYDRRAAERGIDVVAYRCGKPQLAA
jgi:hypothetical protein